MFGKRKGKAEDNAGEIKQHLFYRFFIFTLSVVFRLIFGERKAIKSSIRYTLIAGYIYTAFFGFSVFCPSPAERKKQLSHCRRSPNGGKESRAGDGDGGEIVSDGGNGNPGRNGITPKMP